MGPTLYTEMAAVVNKNADNPATKMSSDRRDLQIYQYNINYNDVCQNSVMYEILFYHCFFCRSVNIMKIDKHGIRQSDCL